MDKSIIKNKSVLILLAFAVVSIVISFYYLGYSRELGSDALEFKQAADFLSTGVFVPKDIIMYRVLPSPLFLYVSIALDSIVKDLTMSFAIVNIISYFLLVFAFYYFVLEIYRDKRVAFISTFLVLSNYYVIDPGNLHLADMPGWFFLILSSYLALKYINTEERKFYFYSILASAIGVFFKEYGGLGFVNLALLIFISNLSRTQKVKDLLLGAVLFGFPLVSYHIFAYFYYGVTYLDKFVSVSTASSLPGYQAKSLALLVKIFGWLFSFGWLAFLYGAYCEWKIKDMRRIKILFCLFPITMTFLIWPAITQRLAVILIFWLALVAGFGLSKIKWYLLYPFLGLYIWFNFSIKILIDKINLPF